MAIQAPNYIMPDPVRNWATGFETADRSARDYARLQLEQQRMAEQAVERARQRKADDFNLMLKALTYQDSVADRMMARDQQQFSNQTSRYNAETSRMNALSTARRVDTVRRINNDPLGLGGNVPPSSDVPSGSGPYGPDNFDSSTPDIPEGDYGDGVDPNVDDPNNPSLRQLEQDNATWASGGTPESAIPQTPLTGTEGPPPVIPGNDFVGPPVPSTMVPPPTAPTDLTPPDSMQPLAPPPPPPAMAQTPQVPSTMDATAAPQDNLLPPPVAVPSFAEADLTQEARNSLYDLYRTNAALTKTASEKSKSATRTAAAMTRVTDPVLRQKYQDRYDSEVAAAEAAAAQASEAKIKMQETAAKAQVIDARQKQLAMLSHLDGVLPEEERKALMQEAADPKAGNMADRKITILKAYDQTRQKAYDQTRQAFGLDYPSKGLATAENVARVGLEMATPNAIKDREESQRADVYRKLIEDNKKLADDSPDKKDEKTTAAWEAELVKLTAGDIQWKNREKLFKKAVDADRRPVPEVVDTNLDGSPIQPDPAQVPGAAPAAAAPAPAIVIDPFKPLPDTPDSWNAIKEKVLTDYPGLKDKLEKIAKEKPLFRAQAIRSAIQEVKGSKADGALGSGRTVIARLDRSGPNELTLEEVSAALVAQMNDGRMPKATGQFTIKRL